MARSRGTPKPNIVVIWGDDIGLTNLSCYSNGVSSPSGPPRVQNRPSSFIT
jgi:arylsulfatase A-like enzyme